MGKHKRSAARALDWLAAQGCEIAAVGQPPEPDGPRAEQRLDLAAERHGLPLADDDGAAREPPEDVDVVISFLFPKLIREPLLSLGRIGCLNFHPAPLPDFRGLGGYNVAILEGLRRVGRVVPLRGRALRHRRPRGGGALPDRSGAATAFSLDLESQERLSGCSSG